MYQIAEWIRRYEVSIKGREPKDGEELRAGPLAYIRLKVYGHKQGTGFRRMQFMAGERTMEVFGIFCKFLEISGNQLRENRGKLLNEKDEPATIEDLAFILNVPIEQITHAIMILSSPSIGWILNDNPPLLSPLIQPNITKHNSTQGYGNLRNFPEKTGNTSYTYTLQEVKDACVLNGISENNAQSYFDQYNSQEWKKANNQSITNLRSHIAKRWNKSKQCWDFDEKRNGETETVSEQIVRMEKEGKI